MFCRANRSTPGASRLQVDQVGAQNQTSSGVADGDSKETSTRAPVARSTTRTAGSVRRSGEAAADGDVAGEGVVAVDGDGARAAGGVPAAHALAISAKAMTGAVRRILIVCTAVSLVRF